MDPDRDLIDEQIAYYRARAGEYDDTSMPEGDPIEAHIDRIRAALRASAPRGRVLELAAGTGQWTGILAEAADDLLVTDASPEMLELNRSRMGDRPSVRYQVADAFAMEPTHAHDAVFLGFFLSHVPPRAFKAFWDVLDGLLASGGRILFVDEGVHESWGEDWIDEPGGVVRRPLKDGSVHRAVKVIWRTDELTRRLAELGWDPSVTAEGPFYWGSACRR